MPEASTEFGKIKDAVHHVAQDMESTSASSKHASDALGNILKTLLVVDITLKGLEKASAFSPMARNLKEAFTTLGKTQEQLRAIHYADLVAAEQKLKSGELTKAQTDEIAAKTQIRFPILNAQLKLEEEMRKVGALRLILLGGALSQTVQMLRATYQLNDALIKANATWGARYDLTQENYAVQRQLGVSFGTIIEAQRALINYGMQNSRTYTATLKTVVELHEGLGMSVQAASELAVITERQIKVSFKETADIVAQLVNETSLTADEVERIAKTLGPLILAIQPRGAPAFPQIAQALGQYEDAIKRLGGMGDEFTQMVAKMMKPEGLLQAGVLGMTDPRKLLEASGVKQTMEAFRRFTDQMLGSSVGMDRIQRMQMLADTFSTSYEQMSLMVEAVKNANTQLGAQTTLEERFRMQMAEAGKSFGQIYKSLVTLIQQALSPLATMLSWTGKFINDWIIQPIMKYKTLLVMAWAAVWAGIVAVIVQLRHAFMAFATVAAEARAAAASLLQYAAAQQAAQAVQGPMGQMATAAGGTAVGQIEADVAKKVVPSIRGAFTTAGKDFSTAMGQQKGVWTGALAEFFRPKPTGDLAEKMVPWYKQILFFSKESFSSTKGFFTKLVAGSATQSALLASINARLLLLGGAVSRTIGGILTPILSVLVRTVAFLLTPIGLLLAAVSAIAAYFIWRDIKMFREIRGLKEDQKLAQLRIADMGNRLLEQQKTRIYLEARAGHREQAEHIYKRMMLDIEKGIGVAEGKNAVERAVMKAELSAYVEKSIGLAQYTKSQFGELRVTPAVREEQAKEDLAFQQKIAENTKKLNDEAKKAQEEENRRAEAERQERELRYLRDGGAVGRYTWA
jgi:hypothetical protein